MGENILRSFFDDDFILGFGGPTCIRYNTASTKDMNPAVWSKWKETEGDVEKELGYKGVVRTVGVDEEDVKVSLERDGLIVEGKTTFEGYTYSQYVKLPISRDVISNISGVSYRSKNGMTYVYLNVRTPEYKQIKVQKID